MKKLNLPSYNLKTDTSENVCRIFDVIRKKYVVLTPEEWVRQNFVHFLINEKKYPPSLLSMEIPLKVGKLSKRADIVLFNSSGDALVAVECKSPDIKISQKTFDQISIYNSVLKVKYVIITNGMEHYCLKLDYDAGSFSYTGDIPSLNEI